MLGGLRLEDGAARPRPGDRRPGRTTPSYFSAYPSLHLAYKFTDAQQLTLSYSRARPAAQPEDLNPFRVESDPLNFQAGNPNLQPQTTDSFEAGYQYKAGETFYLATLYYRQQRARRDRRGHRPGRTACC